jgi:hypothetical protein
MDLVRALSMLFLLLIVAISPAAATQATVTEDSLAANSKELFDKMTGLAVDGDKEAWMALVQEGLLDGSIIWMYKGDKVYWEGSEGWLSGVVKIRLPGTTEIYYTNMENVELD